MEKYLYIFIGGSAGGLLRVMATRADNIFTLGGMDLTILLVNITGAFLLGVFLSGAAHFKSFHPALHLGIAVGLFGSFTTFSTLCLEATGLLRSGQVVGFALYIFISCGAGLAAVQLGFLSGKGTGLLMPIRTGRTPLVAGLHEHALPPITQEAEGD